MSKLNRLFNSRSSNKNDKKVDRTRFKIDGYTLEDIQEFINDVGIDDKEIESEVYTNLIVAALTIIMLVQLRYSSTEAPQYFDGLPCTKYYKKRVITSTPGVVWCTIIPAYETYDFLDLKLEDILETFIGDPILPTKKIKKLTKENCTEFFKSRRTSILGSLNSCPATQSAYFNLDSNCVNWSINEALKFICPNGLPDNITKEKIIEVLVDQVFTISNDKKVNDLSFDEPNNINSKIEKEIFADKISRNNKVETSLKQDGNLPDNRLTEKNLQQVFTPSEIRRYKVALRFGDKSTLKTLNELAKSKLEQLGNQSDSDTASAATSSGDKPKSARKPAGKSKNT